MTDRLDRAIRVMWSVTVGRTFAKSVIITPKQREAAQALIADFLKPDPPAPIDPDAITIGSSAPWGEALLLAKLHARAGLPEETET